MAIKSGTTSDAEHARASARLIPKDAAEYLAVAVSTLARWRVTGEGPLHICVGRAIRYDLRDLDSWLESRKRRSTSDKSAAGI